MGSVRSGRKTAQQGPWLTVTSPALAATPDSGLVHKARGGDRDAFAQLYRRHHDDVALVCRRRMRQEHLVADMVQETFRRLFASLETLQHPEKVGHWLKVAAKRACIDHAKRASVRHEVQLADETADRIADPAVDIAGECEARQVVELILQHVPPGEALLLRERYLEDRSHAEIAVRHGSTPGSIGVRMHRARARAAEFVDAHGLRVLLPLPLAIWVRRVSERLPQPQAPVTMLLAPLLVASLGGTAWTHATSVASSGDGGPLVIIAEPRPVPPQRMTVQRSDPASPAPRDVGAQDPSLMLPTTASSTDPVAVSSPLARVEPTVAPVAAPPATHAAESAPPPVADFDPVPVPGTDRQMAPTPPPGEEPEYEVGVDAGTDVEGVPVEAHAATYDDPEVEPAYEAACTAAEATVVVVYCDRGSG